jgi:hypothetical protein
VIERRVLEGLKGKLLAPDRITQFGKEFHEEWDREAAIRDRNCAALHAELGDAERLTR